MILNKLSCHINSPLAPSLEFKWAIDSWNREINSLGYPEIPESTFTDKWRHGILSYGHQLVGSFFLDLSYDSSPLKLVNNHPGFNCSSSSFSNNTLISQVSHVWLNHMWRGDIGKIRFSTLLVALATEYSSFHYPEVPIMAVTRNSRKMDHRFHCLGYESVDAKLNVYSEQSDLVMLNNPNSQPYRLIKERELSRQIMKRSFQGSVNSKVNF